MNTATYNNNNNYRQHLQDIKTRLDCRDMYQNITGQQPVSRSAWHLFRAPGRTDRHPSFGVKFDGFKDFATGDSGDCFALISLLLNYDHRTAVQWAETYLGMASYAPSLARHSAQKAPPRRESSPAAPDADWQRHALDIVGRAERHLWSPDPAAQRALHYLRHDRGLSDDTIRRFRLGFTPTWTKTACRKPDGTQARLSPGIVIPRFKDERLIKINVRCVQGGLARALQRAESDGPKYLQLAGSDNGALFLAGEISPQLPVVLVEGEFDAMLGVQMAGDVAAFATLGSASTTLGTAEAARLMNARRLLACVDNDAAGAGGLQRLRATLPGLRMAALPSEVDGLPVKDLTDYVMAGGDVRAFLHAALAAEPGGPLAALPDSWRTAALHARLAPALMPYEVALASGLQRFTVAQLTQAAQALGIAIPDQTLRRGLTCGTGVFWQFLPKSDSESLSQRGQPDSLSESGKNTTAGRKAQVYQLLPLAEVKRVLKERLASRLVEKYFDLAGANAVVPPVQAEMLLTLEYAESEVDDLAASLETVLKPVHEREAASLRARLLKVQRMYHDLAGDLDRLHSTPVLPGSWGSRDYEARFLRAVVTADVLPRSRAELAQITGRSASNVGTLLTRAGLENRQRPPALVPISQPVDVVREAFALSKGRGKLHDVVALRNGQPIAAELFHPATAQAFAEAHAQSGATIAIRIWERAEQVVVADVQAPKPRARRVMSPDASPGRSQATPPVQAVPAMPSSTFTGAGYDPAWVRRVLLLAYLRLSAIQQREIAYPVVADLSGRELVELLLLEYPDTVDDPLLHTLIEEHGGTIVEG